MDRLIGKNLAKLRAKNSYKASDIAVFLNLSEEEIRDIELGVQEISTEHLYMLAKLYNVSIDDILERYKTDDVRNKRNYILYVQSVLMFVLYYGCILTFGSDQLLIDTHEKWLVFTVFTLFLTGGIISFISLFLNYLYFKGQFNSEKQYRFINVIFSGWYMITALFNIFFLSYDALWFVIVFFLVSIVGIIEHVRRYSRSSMIYDKERTVGDNRNVVIIIGSILHGLYGLFLVLIIVTQSGIEDYFYVFFTGLVILISAIVTVLNRKRFMELRKVGTLLLLVPVVVNTVLFTHELITNGYDWEIVPFLIGIPLIMAVPAFLFNYDLFEFLYEKTEDM